MRLAPSCEIHLISTLIWGFFKIWKRGSGAGVLRCFQVDGGPSLSVLESGESIDGFMHLVSFSAERSEEEWVSRITLHAFRFNQHLGQVDSRCVCSRLVTFRNVKHSCFQLTIHDDTLFFITLSAVQRLSRIIRAWKFSCGNFFVSCRSFLSQDTSEGLRQLVFVTAERANEVFWEQRFSFFGTETCNDTAYFNKHSKDMPRVYSRLQYNNTVIDTENSVG